jgi:hypothetical protein
MSPPVLKTYRARRVLFREWLDGRRKIGVSRPREEFHGVSQVLRKTFTRPGQQLSGA